MGVGGQHHAPAALPPSKTRYPFYRRPSGSQGRSGRVRKISSQPGFDCRTVQAVASRYTDWAIAAHKDVEDCRERWGTPSFMEGPQWKRSNIHNYRCAKIFKITEEGKRVVVRNWYWIIQRTALKCYVLKSAPIFSKSAFISMITFKTTEPK